VGQEESETDEQHNQISIRYDLDTLLPAVFRWIIEALLRVGT
jgi:hypothetical protein